MKASRAKNMPAAEVRFWSRVNRRGDDDCWLWTGFCLLTGYGRFAVDGRHVYAHRYSFEIANGPIPSGHGVFHHCDVRNCCNPKHLFSGVQADNMADMRSKGRGFVPESPKGEANPAAKLTKLQVDAIRERYAEGGVSYGKLAKEHGVHKSLIANIVKGKLWKEVADTEA